MTARYVTDADGKGWLNVRWGSASGPMFPPLPQYLSVDHERTEGGRDYFTVSEGQMRGKKASVKLKTGGASNLALGNPGYAAAAKVVFNRRTKELRYGTAGPVAAKTHDGNPVPLGTYDLELPYEAHSLGAPYESQTIYAKTWFRVGHTGDRFLHPGRVSAGCVTVTNLPEWTKIYKYLIKARLGDGASVGKLQVVE
jgi:hypothetical protein